MKEGRSVVRFGVFELDVSAGELRKQGRKINLQQQPFQVLALLLRRPGELVTREDLQQALWPADTFVEFDQGLNTAIKKIRQALDDSADHPRFVETLPRKGYRFITAVSDAGSGGESSAPATASGRRMLWAAGSLVLLAAVGAAGWLLNKPNETAEATFVPVPLTTYPGREARPSFSPDGNQVAFDWNRIQDFSEPTEEHAAIYVKLVGENEPLRLTNGCCPTWSPDGRAIAFFRFEAKAGLFLISPIGGSERKLADLEFAPDYDHRVAWHPSGKWLVVSDGGSEGEPQGLFALSLQSGEKRRLTSPSDGFADKSPAVSFDGEAIVFARGSEGNHSLYLLGLSESLQPKGEPRRITTENTYNNDPAWTPDGRAIVFSSGNFHSPSLYEILFSPPGRPGKPRRLTFAGRGVRMPAISRQGRLAYATWVSGGAHVWRLELNGSRRATAPPTRLIASTWIDHVPEYSPDGQRIAFASNRSGSHEIWACNSDGSGAMQLTSLGPSFYTADPHWSPDGRLILFHSNPEGHAGTYVIDSGGGKPKFFLANSVVDSWSHDGKWIYFAAENQVWKRPWPPSEKDGEAVQITRKGGDLARESPDGRTLYYQKNHDDLTSLWKVPVEGGEETQVLESVCCQNFVVIEEGIYFIPGSNPGDNPSIEYLSFATGKVETIATLSDAAAYGFSVSPDGRWLLYSQYKPWESDLWMVENFR